MGFNEDDRIRHKNLIFKKINIEVVCSNCGAEFDNDEVKDFKDEECPRCDEKTLSLKE